MDIKSVTFKNESTESLNLAGMRVTRDTLTPEIYLRLVGISPKFAENFDVQLNKKAQRNNGEADQRGTDTASVGPSDK